FEHVKNAPVRGNPVTGGFTFNKGNGVAMPPTPPSDSSTPAMPAPYNVERLYKIASDIEAVNTGWQKSLADAGSVWSNYQLVLVQWPSISHAQFPGQTTLFGPNGAQPAPPCVVAERDNANIANSVMETFLQTTPGSNPPSLEAMTCPTDEKNLGHTCMGCH